MNRPLAACRKDGKEMPEQEILLDFPQPHFDVEFYASLPWILAEPRE